MCYEIMNSSGKTNGRCWPARHGGNQLDYVGADNLRMECLCQLSSHRWLDF